MTNIKQYSIFLFILSLILLPLIIDSYFLQVTIISLIFVILALSLNLIMGIAGQLSLCHAAFFGVGAYSSALFAMKLNLSFWVVMPMATLFTGLIGFLIAIPSLRLRGHYLAIVTLGFGELIYQVFERWESVTRGVMALTEIPRPTPILGLNFQSKIHYYYLILCLVGFVLFFIHQIINSRVGRALKAIREDEVSAQALGINTHRFKIIIFAIGTSIAGLAGSFHAHYQTVLAPTEFTLVDSVRILMMIIIGGLGSMPGSVIGAIIVYWLPEILRPIGNYRDIVFGLLVVLIIIFCPGGFIELYRDTKVFCQKIFSKICLISKD